MFQSGHAYEVFVAAHYLDPNFKGVALQEVYNFDSTKRYIKERNSNYEDDRVQLGKKGVADELVEGEVDNELEEAGFGLSVGLTILALFWFFLVSTYHSLSTPVIFIYAILIDLLAKPLVISFWSFYVRY